MHYTTEYLEDGTIVIANQVIQGGIKHDVAKSNIIVRENTIYMGSDGAAIQIVDSEYPQVLIWAQRPFAWLGWWRIVSWLRSWHKSRYRAIIQDNVILGSGHR